MNPKASFYFVLYLVGIVNLLTMITERDYALDSLMRDYRKPLTISVAGLTEWKINEFDSLDILVSELKDDQERSSIQYHVEPQADLGGKHRFSTSPTVDAKTGNARIAGTFSTSGEYRFSVWADVTRRLPKDAGGHRIRTTSDTASFTILVSKEKHVIPGAKFSIGVDRHNEHWISGVPYRKTLFVNSDPRKVRLTGLPEGFRRNDVGSNTIELLWDKPMPGTMQIALSGNAGRSLDPALDAANVKFALNIEPPTWNPAPPKSAYWNIPYSFASKVGQLDVNDYAIRVFANSSIPVQSASGGQFPLVIMPEKSWTSLTFIATTSSGYEMLRTEIPVKTPPPPQIKWTSSRLQGDDYVITFNAEDIGGRDANVNCAIVSPNGLTGVLSARHGKSFTFTVKNVTETRPQAVIVRTSIHGIGGVSTPLDRTFPILY